jgi:branched-chain amino acid transport system permease protein
VRLKLSLEAIAFLVLVAVVAWLPRVVSDYRTYELAFVGIYFIALVGLGILTGYNGQISLGHGAFMGIGAYTTAILSVDHGIRDVWTIPVAGVIAGLAGLLVGIPALRLSGLYLALVTFGIAVAFPQLLKKYGHFTGGTTGKALNVLKTPFGLHTSPNHWLYYLTWGIALVLLVGAWILLRSKSGRTWQAIRDSEIAAVSAGISIPQYKTLAFAISAFYAGVAGGLFAIGTFYITPDVFSVVLSINLVVGLAAGGLGSLSGLLGGAALVYYLTNHSDAIGRWVNHLPYVAIDPKTPGLATVIFGAVLILVMLILPTGAGGLVRRLLSPFTRRLYTRT